MAALTPPATCTMICAPTVAPEASLAGAFSRVAICSRSDAWMDMKDTKEKQAI